jgi:uncharacterized protein YggE
MEDTTVGNQAPSANQITEPPTNQKGRFKKLLKARYLVILLVIVIGVMLGLWRPWTSQPQISGRTISITGDSTLKATPDEFVFSPSYDFTNVDKQTALTALTSQSNTMIAKLKGLGVADNQIQTNSTGNNSYFYSYTTNQDNTFTYTLYLTIKVDSQSLAQKVQDYLTTTSPTGDVSPSAQFSNAKQKNLENQARTAAIKDARSKAEQSAQNLGFKLGAVKSVDDSNGFSNPGPCGGFGVCSGVNNAISLQSGSAPSLAVQPGQNELDYSIGVVYYIH